MLRANYFRACRTLWRVALRFAFSTRPSLNFSIRSPFEAAEGRPCSVCHDDPTKNSSRDFGIGAGPGGCWRDTCRRCTTRPGGGHGPPEARGFYGLSLRSGRREIGGASPGGDYFWLRRRRIEQLGGQAFARASGLRVRSAGFDCGVYAKADYSLDILQSDMNAIAQSSLGRYGDHPPPLILGGWSMGAEQSVAAAGGHTPRRILWGCC